ncbi:IS630 family transposase [Metallosphaera hakonensis JCM 8857 = DSM 7519]|uniref:IS630 family transposase n=1 Tax=Metallosphaera hakonensis JCM 8857 = DSM 7519 TaxID=1293036 RepID=A0A2U9IWK7_9CREN|nr:IS630 family transposase [Metallosphaera hakonensis JCM 8857 = DSM 7519]
MFHSSRSLQNVLNFSEVLTGFSSTYVLLAVNAWTGEVVFTVADRPNSESVKYFLRYFKRRVGKGRSYLFMDNASPHKTQGVREVSSKKGIHLEYIPKYSPELNLAEAVFKQLKAYLSNRLFSSLDELRDCILKFFAENNYKFNLNAVKYLGLDKIERS